MNEFLEAMKALQAAGLRPIVIDEHTVFEDHWYSFCDDGLVRPLGWFAKRDEAVAAAERMGFAPVRVMTELELQGLVDSIAKARSA